MYQWLCINKLSTNLKKTTNYNIIGDVLISINGNDIISVHVTKFLGVYIDEKLTWKDHIFYIFNKLSKSIAIIYYARPLLHQCALINLYCALILPCISYFALIFPSISYCAMVWGNTYHANLLPLFIKQKHVIRIMCNARYREHTSQLFYNLKLLAISNSKSTDCYFYVQSIQYNASY